MKCMYCGCMDSKVIDSRLNEDGTSIRRRRECVNCGKRFTTYETVEHTPIMVVKNGGNRQAFDASKIKNGIVKSCEKRPVSMYEIEKLVSDIEKQIYNSLEQEITSKQIGDMVMEGLKNIDDVAYVRFASVHKHFKDINTLLQEIEELLGGKNQEIREKLLDEKKKK
ncbi:MAG: transcriptional regulator NrdR [Clostridia bacterium]|nr:transcriptional regulator NrdR [Clostridia bacterium]MDY5264724.1 transcriptional regulator NrdR [Eubacteriales bacterium]MDY5439736.1 transcriptional regulator NrdR [Eubacteriales bacterium]